MQLISGWEMRELLLLCIKIPPTDQRYIPYTDVDVYQYNIEHDDDDVHFSKIRDEQGASVPWIAVSFH